MVSVGLVVNGSKSGVLEPPIYLVFALVVGPNLAIFELKRLTALWSCLLE